MRLHGPVYARHPQRLKADIGGGLIRIAGPSAERAKSLVLLDTYPYFDEPVLSRQEFQPIALVGLPYRTQTTSTV